MSCTRHCSRHWGTVTTGGGHEVPEQSVQSAGGPQTKTSSGLRWGRRQDATKQRPQHGLRGSSRQSECANGLTFRSIQLVARDCCAWASVLVLLKTSLDWENAFSLFRVPPFQTLVLGPGFCVNGGGRTSLRASVVSLIQPAVCRRGRDKGDPDRM